jgi:hypothetical protein
MCGWDRAQKVKMILDSEADTRKFLLDVGEWCPEFWCGVKMRAKHKKSQRSIVSLAAHERTN